MILYLVEKDISVSNHFKLAEEHLILADSGCYSKLSRPAEDCFVFLLVVKEYLIKRTHFFCSQEKLYLVFLAYPTANEAFIINSVSAMKGECLLNWRSFRKLLTK